MSIEDDAQSDLALNEDDAENVMGGKKAKHHSAPKSAPHTSGPTMIKVTGSMGAVTSTAQFDDNCDPDPSSDSSGDASV